MAFGMGMNYYTPMDREYSNSEPREPFGAVNEATNAEVEAPIVSTKEIGTSVTEGNRFGTLNQQVSAAIKKGVSRIELATQMGGGMEPVGAESYGQEARQDLRELSRASNIEFTSVHTPSNVGNLSGYNPQEGNFSDNARQQGLDEVKKAINFAADVSHGGAVVVHTGEFFRPIFDAKWNKEGKWKDAFVSYDEEPERASIMLVDDRNGRVVSQGINRSETVYEPLFHTAEHSPDGENLVGKYDAKKGAALEEGDYVDVNGNWLNPKDVEDMFQRVPEWDAEKTRFKTKAMRYEDFQEKADRYNDKYGMNLTADELFVRTRLENQVLQARGHSLFYGRGYEDEKKRRDALIKALEFYEDIEKNTPKEEQWRLLMEDPMFGRYFGDLVPSQRKLPSEAIKEQIKSLTNDMVHIHESSAASDVQAEEALERLRHIKTAESYGKNKSFTSFAEAGIHAMKQTEASSYAEKPIFVAPENIFPEMGYGSHPDELIELVQKSREKMAHMLTDKYIDDPSGHLLTEKEAKRLNEQMDLDLKEGDIRKINNPYLTDMSYESALDKAKDHIKSTFDTQHLGMWWKHFKALPGETEKDRKERFDGWYMEQVKKMGEEGILGHIHAVDSMGSTHSHLPVGQGVFPVVDAVHYLKKMGYDVSIISEGHGEQGDRQLFKAWQAFGNTIYGMERPGAPVRFGDVHQSYFGHHRPPYHIVGEYSPSNDWTLWTQVPLE